MFRVFYWNELNLPTCLTNLIRIGNLIFIFLDHEKDTQNICPSSRPPRQYPFACNASLKQVSPQRIALSHEFFTH